MMKFWPTAAVSLAVIAATSVWAMGMKVDLGEGHRGLSAVFAVSIFSLAAIAAGGIILVASSALLATGRAVIAVTEKVTRQDYSDRPALQRSILLLAILGGSWLTHGLLLFRASRL